MGLGSQSFNSQMRATVSSLQLTVLWESSEVASPSWDPSPADPHHPPSLLPWRFAYTSHILLAVWDPLSLACESISDSDGVWFSSDQPLPSIRS